MTRRAYAAPRLLLSARALDGATRATRERLLEIQERFREPKSLAVTFAKSIEAGAEGVLSAPSPLLREALADLEGTIPLFVVLPALQAQDYRLFEPGVEPLLQRARAQAGAASRLRMTWRGLARGAAFRGGDFAARVPLLLEAESHLFPPRGVAGVVIAAPIADVALAGGHRAFFESVARYVRARFRVPAAFETRNPGTMLRRLREWGARPDFVIGPMNPCGLGMKPAEAETLAELARAEVPFVATELRASGLCALDAGARYARAHGAHGLAPDLSEMDEVAVDLKRMRNGGQP
ncbi:MAG TPA: hypothetical protein VMS88_07580 [Terriglobales bacterium]|nr:hypothetical protein [Terriglobales bacterium]